MIDVLSNVHVLSVLLASVLIGFSCTLVILMACDSRVFDVNGKLTPSPLNHLWGNSFPWIVREALACRQASMVMFKQFLSIAGDGNIAAVNLFGSHVVVISHPDMVKTVLSGHHSKFVKSARSDRTKFVYAEGLMTSGGAKWQTHRHILNPGFQAEALSDIVEVFDGHAKLLAQVWLGELKANQRSYEEAAPLNIEITNIFKVLALRILFQSLFGFDVKSIPCYDQMILDMDIIMNEIHSRVLDDVTDWWPALFPGRGDVSKLAVKRMHHLIDEIIIDRLEQYEERRAMGMSTFDNVKTDMLDLLLTGSEDKSQNQESVDSYCSKFTDEELRDHLLTFLVAGYESTASGLVWILYELSRHPEEQVKVQEEIDTIMFAKAAISPYEDDVSLDLDDISRFGYLMQVVKETFRLHPVQPMIVRSSAQECSLGEYRLKAGSTVVINAIAVHQHPDYWYQPEEFYPERFSPENQRETIKHPFQYIPFSAGPRNCIGQRFAQMEMIVVLAVLLSSFSFSVTEEDLEDITFEETSTYHISNLRLNIQMREKSNVSDYMI